MNNREIIEGLMLMLKDENINVTKLVQRIGFKNYKKFDKAYQEAFKIISNE
jgi:hypothetical protein